MLTVYAFHAYLIIWSHYTPKYTVVLLSSQIHEHSVQVSQINQTVLKDGALHCLILKNFNNKIIFKKDILREV